MIEPTRVVILDENPRRKRRGKRSHTKSRKRRHATKTVTPKPIIKKIYVKGHSMRHKKKGRSRKRYRHNPPGLSGMFNTQSLMQKGMQGLKAAGAIAATKVAGNLGADLLKIDRKNKGLVEAAFALFLLPMIPFVGEQAPAAIGAALLNTGKQFLPAEASKYLEGDTADWTTYEDVTDSWNDNNMLLGDGLGVSVLPATDYQFA